jgi:predicted lactoylglutathione lyase
MPTKIAVNLPVRDLPRSTRFFGALGFPADQRLANQNMAAHAISDDIYVILVTDAHFTTLTSKQTPDTAVTCEAIVQLQVESRHRVDELADKALAAGAPPANEPIDQGFLYGRSFRDLDGHHWDVFCIDPGAAEQQP